MNPLFTAFVHHYEKKKQVTVPGTGSNKVHYSLYFGLHLKLDTNTSFTEPDSEN